MAKRNKRNRDRIRTEAERIRDLGEALARKKPEPARPAGQKWTFDPPQVGDRVGAFLSVDQHSIELLGYGVYEGRHRPNVKAIQASEHWTSPRIQLDDGRVVWGFICFYAPETYVQHLVSSRALIHNTHDLMASLISGSRDPDATDSTSDV